MRSFTCILTWFFVVVPCQARIIYVDANTPDNNDGSSWAKAYKYLQDALAAAESGQQIWVAEGTYKPDQGNNVYQGDRGSTFRLKNGVAICGGFVSGGCDWKDRNPVAHKTILSGDLNGDDLGVGDATATAKDNCIDAQEVFSGMTYKGTTVGATNDGSTSLKNDNNPDVWYSYEPSISGTVTFSVSAEDAYFSVSIHSDCPGTKENELTKDLYFGDISLKVEKDKKYYIRIASLENKSSDFVMSVNSNEDNSRHVVSGSGTNSTAILDGFVIARGQAGHEGGGGMYNRSGSPKLFNCTFTKNFTTGFGGGMYNHLNSNPILTDCTFSENHSQQRGGGIYNSSNSSLGLISCMVSKNSAGRGGGIYNVDNSNLKLTNCKFSDNISESYGAGIYSWTNSRAILNECVFSRNIAGDVGGAVYIHTGSLEVADCNFADNSAESFGGAIHNELIELIVTKSLFRNNSAIRGGGIMNSSSSMQIDTSFFKGNSAINAGGGIRNFRAKATVTDCNFIGNTGGYGAGIENYDGSDVNILNCTFEKNSATGGGGGISSRHRSKSEITKCRFIKNHANYAGGGIDNGHSNSTIKDCTFVNNSAQSHGGGAVFNDRGSQSIMDCDFIKNTSRQNGGGILNHQSNTVLTNCTFEGNAAKDFGGGITNVAGATISNCTFSGNAAYRGGGMSNYLGEPYIINCILWGNSANYKKGTAQINNDKCTVTINYSCIQSSTRVDGAGNTNGDPKFVDEGRWDGQPLNGGKWISGDYHLRSQEGRWDPNSQTWVQDNVTSPCIDAGDPNISIGYEPSPNGSIINMGRYGGTHEASKSYSNQEP
jgi:predicted outer membrane repeat protein